VKLTDLLSPRRVVVPLRAATWAEGIRLLVDACVADGSVEHPARLDEVVRAALPADTLTLGPNAVLPHFRTDAVGGVVAALGVAPEPMAGPNRELPGLRIMLLVIAPPGEAVAYLQSVAAFTRALARPEVVAALHTARSGAEVLALPELGGMRLEGQLLAGDLVPPAPFALSPDMPLDEAARLLLGRGLVVAPVVGAAGEVIGMLSMHELLRFLGPAYVHRVQSGESPAVGRAAAARPGDAHAVPVREAMSRNVLCVSEDQSLAEVTSLLASKDVAGVPVVRDGTLRGFLTRGDIVRKLLG
jgi:CBS domain-containing protein/mannitol/fructose-specific phosphotransferase system IIA component (Ntr-type)